MRPVFEFFIKNYRASILVAIVMVLAGLLGSKSVRRESRPPVDFARVNIATIYPGSSPEEVEEKITVKIEDELRGINGIKDINSSSQAGRSSVSIRIDIDNVDDTQFVVDEIQRAVQRVRDLPKEILDNPMVTHINAKEIPVFKLALVGSNKGRARDKLAKQLKEILEDENGVAEVVLGGNREREFQILLDPVRMQRNHVGISQVVKSVQQQTRNIPAGYVRIPGNQKLVRITGQIRSSEQMGDIVVRSNFSGRKIVVNDVADVRDGMEDAASLVRVNGESATLLTITKKVEADTIRSAEGLIKQIDLFEERLPQGYKIISYDNESERIGNRLGIVVNNALVGLLLVVFILLLFLPGAMGLTAALSLPLAIFGTVGTMSFFGINFNNITMLAMVIAIGMLVDNAVVISENYARLRLEGMNNVDAAIKAVHQFWLPLTATVATTIVAFLPMLVTKGVMGQFILWIPIMVSIALGISLLEAFFLLPARLQFTIKDLDKFRDKNKGNNTTKTSTWFDKLKERFNRFMGGAVKHRYLVLGAVSALLISSILAAIFLNRFELFPSEEVEYYFANFETPITTTLKRTDEIAAEISQKITDAIGEDEIRYVIAQSGFSRTGTGSKNSHHVGMLTINIPTEIAKTQDPQEILKKLRTIKHKDVTKLIIEEARNGPPVGRALNVAFRSSDYNKLKALVEEFKAKISEIDGVVDLEDDEVRSGLEYKLTPDYSSLARMNLSTESVGTALRTALQGAIASELSLDGDEFWLRIRYKDSERETINALKMTKIMEPQGRMIPLMSVVKMSQEEGPAVRKHYNFKRAISVVSAVEPTKITSGKLNSKAEKIFAELQSKYSGVSATFGGERESSKESTSSLKNAMIIAVIGIFSILVLMFNGFLLAGLILSSIPLGLVGVCWAFVLHGRPLSFLALIGIVGLAGVVVNSAIVLVSYIKDLEKNEPQLSRNELLAKASSDRLRAVMVTSLTTVGGLFPTAYGWGGYDSILVPMTMALAWGLVSGTLLTIIWIPCGYAIIADISQWLSKTFPRIAGRLNFSKNDDKTDDKTDEPKTWSEVPDVQNI